MNKLFPIIGCTLLMASCTGIYKNYERPQQLTQSIDSLYRNTTENVVKADTATTATHLGNKCLLMRNCKRSSTKHLPITQTCSMPTSTSSKFKPD